MAKLAAQLKSKFFSLVGRITVCGRAGHKDAAAAGGEPKSASSQHVEIRARSGPPKNISEGSSSGNH